MATASDLSDDETEVLLRGAGRGNGSAVSRLLARYRARLTRMVALRSDPRVAARFDPSDVVQEALADAARKLGGYLRDRPLPFYAWLHRLAAERLAQAHRRHLGSKARGVGREALQALDPAGGPSLRLVDRLAASDTTPGHHLVRSERHERLHAALSRLTEIDREVLRLRYIDQLRFAEIAATLGVGEGAAMMRHVRALQRLRCLLDEEVTDGGLTG